MAKFKPNEIATASHCIVDANATAGLYVTQPDISMTFEN